MSHFSVFRTGLHADLSESYPLLCKQRLRSEAVWPATRDVEKDFGFHVTSPAQGLSQERLALAAGIDRAHVGRVERGSENVTISTLEAMAGALAHLLVEPEAHAAPPASLKAGRKPAC